jgi:hypothetical protein
MQATEIHTFPVAATEESQADKGIDHPLVTCSCGTIWRARQRSRCPMGTCEEGTLMTLDARQSSNLFVAMNQLDLIGNSLIQPQLSFELGKFRDLLREYAPWYDSMNRRMIQACYQSVRSYGDPSQKAALAIAFFKEDYKWASDDEKTFCREDDLNWQCPIEQ